MFIYTLKDIILVGAISLFALLFFTLWLAEKVMFFGEQKGWWSSDWRQK